MDSTGRWNSWDYNDGLHREATTAECSIFVKVGTVWLISREIQRLQSRNERSRS